MDKYQQSLIRSVQKQMSLWFDSSVVIGHEELVRFFHSVKGTAGTVGLLDLSETAGGLLAQLEDGDEQDWTPETLRSFVYPFLKISYEQQLALETVDVSKQPAKAGIESLILIVDDDATMLMYLKEHLEQHGWMVIATTDPNKAIRYFHDMKPDCLIVDIQMPGKNGFEVMEVLKDKLQHHLIPSVMISIRGDKQTRLRSFRLGADDFLSKPIDTEELIARIERSLERRRLLDGLLLMDELTGAFNRKYLATVFERNVLELQRKSEPFSLSMIDLDHFKKVNDTYGHIVGDQVLSGFASFVKQRGRASDVLIRFGGEEFVLVLPGTRGAQAKEVIARLLDEFAKQPFHSGATTFHVTFSAGAIEVADPEMPMQQVLNLADAALYKAKEAGRRRVELADSASCQIVTPKVKVAVVDDDAIIRSILSESIKEMLEPDVAAELTVFRDGIAFLESGWHTLAGPRLVILDGMMPGMDGLEVLQKLRASPESEQVLVMMLTGRKSEQDIVRALQLGADDYLTKPFSMAELEARTKRLLQRMISFGGA
ncbi:MAG: Signal transduction diguanylate cyclase domain [Paenibacillus sp.]|nr:Signal transduction diguanylate cyclase domain [Paenibacillus sp.]